MVTRLARRLLSLALIVTLLPLLVALAPFMLVGLAIGDLVTGRPDLPLPRLYIFAIVFVVHEWLGQIAAAAIWLAGFVTPDDTIDQANRAIQSWWAGSLLGWARRVMRVRFDLPDLSTLPTGQFIVLSRHSSMIDAIVPMWIITTLAERPVHYVLKKELEWDPNLGVYGRRLDNHFVNRRGDTDRETFAIEAMAKSARPASGLVIFPEGTYATDANRLRVRRSLVDRGLDQAVAYADGLLHLLPPRPAGSIALLRARPDATVMIFGHVGLEGVAELSGLRANLPARRDIVVRWWLHDNDTLPETDIEREAWLRDRWTELDDWVGRQESAP